MKARNNGLSFSQINDDNVRSVLDNVMLKGAGIYGCSLPQTEFFAKIIADELQVLLNDFGFCELTEDEILLALRLNYRTGVRVPSGLELEKIYFSGNTFNIFFIASILEKYMTIRNQLDRRFKNLLDGHE